MDKIEKRPADEIALDKATKALEKGMRLLATQQKIITIANRSEPGWKLQHVKLCRQDVVRKS